MIRTPRLILRPWRADDLPVFAALNADAETMRFLLQQRTRAESDAYAERLEAHRVAHGFGVWAVEAPGVAPFIGAVGLMHVGFEAAFTPAVEAAWRLHRSYWGHGYATEAARAAIADGFERCGLQQVVAFTAVQNVASQRVMQRVGMTLAGEFDHPRVPEGHALRRHKLYRIGRGEGGQA